MSRNLNDWMIKEPIKGNHYKLWKLPSGSVFTISTPTGPVPFQVKEQKGTLTKCIGNGKETMIDSSIKVNYFSNVDNFKEAISA